MPYLDLTLKILGLALSAAGVLAAIYNLATASSRAKHVAKERHDAGRLDEVCLLAARTESRVTGLEGRVGNYEQRIEKRLDQLGADLSKVKDMFTEFLIKNQ